MVWEFEDHKPYGIEEVLKRLDQFILKITPRVDEEIRRLLGEEK